MKLVTVKHISNMCRLYKSKKTSRSSSPLKIIELGTNHFDSNVTSQVFHNNRLTATQFIYSSVIHQQEIYSNISRALFSYGVEAELYHLFSISNHPHIK